MPDQQVATIPRVLIYTCGLCGRQMPWDRWEVCSCREPARARMPLRGLPLALVLSAVLWLLIIAGLGYGWRFLAYCF